MWRQVISIAGWLALLSGLLRACNVPWQAAPVPVGQVVGDLEPWRDDDHIAGRHIVLCRAIGDPREGACKLMDRWATTDAVGHFELADVPAGTYFVLYDSGLSDFQEAMDRWGGQTLHFGDNAWLSEFVGVDMTQENPVFRIPEGLHITPHDGWLQAYCTLTLLIGRSPFIIAHDMEQAAQTQELRCLVFNVVENVTRQLKIQAVYFDEGR